MRIRLNPRGEAVAGSAIAVVVFVAVVYWGMRLLRLKEGMEDPCAKFCKDCDSCIANPPRGFPGYGFNTVPAFGPNGPPYSPGKGPSQIALEDGGWSTRKPSGNAGGGVRPPGGGGGGSVPVGTEPGYQGLPQPSANDKGQCSINGDGTCFALVQHTCINGMKDDSKVPAMIKGFKQGAFNQLFNAYKGRTWKDAAGTRNATKPVFNNAPQKWMSVCAARPKIAGKGQCAHVKPYEWRMWVTQHNDVRRSSECARATQVRATFRGSTLQPATIVTNIDR